MIGFDLQRARSPGVWSFAIIRAYNHQEIPRLNARARRTVRDGHALFEEVNVFNTDSVQRAYCAQNHVCSDRDIHSLRT
jgi:hypothetical protein